MKIAPLLLLLTASVAAAQPFAIAGGDTACIGDEIPFVPERDCQYVVDADGWSPEATWCPEPGGSRLIFIGWKKAAVSSLDPATQNDDVLIGHLPESFIMGSAQASCDAAGIVYLTLVNGELWAFDPDACGDGNCTPTFKGLVTTPQGLVNTIGGDIAFDRAGQLWMIGDTDTGSVLYTVNPENGDAALADDTSTPVPAWGLAAPDAGPLISVNDDNRAYLLTPGESEDIGEIGFQLAEYGGAASEVNFLCSLKVSVGPESPRRAMFGADEPRLEARIRVRHVRPETVDTRLRWWIERDGKRIGPIVAQNLTLGYLDGYGWRGRLPDLGAGAYRFVAEIGRMGQGVARSFAEFEVP